MLVGAGVRRVAIIGGIRIPFARAHGAYATLSNQVMLTKTLGALVTRFGVHGMRLGEVAAGAVMKHPKDFNLVRECVLDSGLHPQTPALDLQRACGTSLEAAILIANKIALGQIDAGIAGGVDSVSDPPLVYPRIYQQLLLRAYRASSTWSRLKPFFGLRAQHFKPEFPNANEPHTKLSMGESCERMAQQWGITRADQDQLALESHLRAAQAWRTGFFDDLVVDCNGLKQDDNLRADSSLAKLARLEPSFDHSLRGTLTAGNSSTLTDGASSVLLASEAWAHMHGLPVLAYLTFGKAWAVDFANSPEGLLMAPAYAIPAMLRDAQLNLTDFDYYEIHEAFAAQVLCTLKAWESPDFCAKQLGLPIVLGSIDRTKLNVCGSSLALGHPFAATGTRILSTLAKILTNQHNVGGKIRRGLISVCTAGGMGVTAILESAI
ncbi:MAG: acetyl-CoA C-acetyltransferase [Gammaproteobacteria bacterium]|nr:acetyl-CoA C-acetyltransferase [Gammaproteobacteria bacterium]